MFLSAHVHAHLSIIRYDETSCQEAKVWSNSLSINNVASDAAMLKSITLVSTKTNATLIHLPPDKMATIMQTIFPDAFSWMKHFVFW